MYIFSFKSRKKQSHVLFILGSCSCKHCKESFLFSLVNPSGAWPTLLPLKGTKNQNGFFYKSSYGPTLEQALTCSLPVEQMLIQRAAAI